MAELPGVPGIPGLPNPLDLLSGGVAGAGGELLSTVGKAISTAIGDAVSKALGQIGDLLANASGRISFSSGWWTSPATQRVLATVAGIALALMLACLLLAVIQGVLAGDPGLMVRALAVELPTSIFGMVTILAIADALIVATDKASAAVLSGAPADFGTFVAHFGAQATLLANGLVGGIIEVLFLAGAMLIWVELLVRSGLVFLLAAFAPLTLAARVWPAARGAWRKLCELGVALIVSKFAIALALALGASALAGGGATAPGQSPGGQAGQSLAGAVTGAGLILVASLTPFVILKLVPMVEGAVAAQGISRSPVRGARTVASTATTAIGVAGRAAAAGGSGPGAQFAGSPPSADATKPAPRPTPPGAQPTSRAT